MHSIKQYSFSEAIHDQYTTIHILTGKQTLKPMILQYHNFWHTYRMQTISISLKRCQYEVSNKHIIITYSKFNRIKSRKFYEKLALKLSTKTQKHVWIIISFQIAFNPCFQVPTNIWLQINRSQKYQEAHKHNTHKSLLSI